jgi:hypothetical protein
LYASNSVRQREPREEGRCNTSVKENELQVKFATSSVQAVLVDEES